MERSVLPDDGINGENFHESVELLQREFPGFRGIAEPEEMPVFSTLCKKKSSPLPEESFNLAHTPAAEEEQCVRNKERQMVPLLHNGSEDIHYSCHSAYLCSCRPHRQRRRRREMVMLPKRMEIVFIIPELCDSRESGNVMETGGMGTMS